MSDIFVVMNVTLNGKNQPKSGLMKTADNDIPTHT